MCYRTDYASKRDKVRWQRILRDYGVSQDSYTSMLKAQDGVCAICKQPERAERFKFLAVDHDHRTNAVRGLLCHRCNAGLGNFYDSVALIREAGDYLERHALQSSKLIHHKPPRNHRKLTIAHVQEIWGRYEHGESQSSIAKRIGISGGYVSRILAEYSWCGSKDGYPPTVVYAQEARWEIIPRGKAPLFERSKKDALTCARLVLANAQRRS